jgi:hypothetical protein
VTFSVAPAGAEYDPEDADHVAAVAVDQLPLSELTVAEVAVSMTLIDAIGYAHWPGVNGSFESIRVAEKVTVFVLVGEI